MPIYAGTCRADTGHPGDEQPAVRSCSTASEPSTSTCLQPSEGDIQLCLVRLSDPLLAQSQVNFQVQTKCITFLLTLPVARRDVSVSFVISGCGPARTHLIWNRIHPQKCRLLRLSLHIDEHSREESLVRLKQQLRPTKSLRSAEITLAVHVHSVIGYWPVQHGLGTISKYRKFK